MNELWTSLKDFAIKLLNTTWFSGLFSTFFAGIVGFYTARFTATKPNKLQVKQQQLDNVYLPLHKLLKDMPETISPDKACEYSQIISDILDEHYLLVFPQLHQLSNQLRETVASEKGYSVILRSIKHQVNIDYELLKKVLGYPSANMLKIFLRMTKKQKCSILLSGLSTIFLFSPLFFADVILPALQELTSFPALVLLFAFYILALFVLIWLKSIVDNMRD